MNEPYFIACGMVRAEIRYTDSKETVVQRFGKGTLLQQCSHLSFKSPTIEVEHFITLEPTLDLIRVSKKDFSLLLAIPNELDRIRTYRGGEWGSLLKIDVGSKVYIYPDECKRGIVRYVGLIGSDACYYGVELLQRSSALTEFDNGLTEDGARFFHARPHTAYYVSINTLRHADFSDTIDELKPPFCDGDRVSYVTEGHRLYGTVEYIGLHPGPNDDFWLCGVYLDEAWNGGNVMHNGKKLLDCRKSHGLLVDAAKLTRGTRIATDTLSLNRSLRDCAGGKSTELLQTNVNLVQSTSVELQNGTLVCARHRGFTIYGVIQWVGELLFVDGLVAGIETENMLPYHLQYGGVWNGAKIYDCKDPAYSTFVAVSLLSPDTSYAAKTTSRKHVGEQKVVPVETDPQPLPLLASEPVRMCGRNRGIQGHSNSCYMDATLFAMFFPTNVFDDMLYRKIKDEPAKIQTLLRDSIIHPLRKHMYVQSDRVMEFREALGEQTKMRGLTKDEKDPEEFLQCLQLLLDLPPLLHFSGNRNTFMYQILNEGGGQRTSIQQLFIQSLCRDNLRLTKVPKSLLLILPRSGKEYKSFDEIIPSRTLDVSAVLEQPCSYSCLQLVSVVCIKSSHYVAFVRGSMEKHTPWIFFDSMADRTGEEGGFNIPQLSLVDDIDRWLDEDAVMSSFPASTLVHRLLSDAYLCVYEQPQLLLY